MLEKRVNEGGTGFVFNEQFYIDKTSTNLNTILQKMGWTQKKLAEELKIAQGMMTEYVRGSRITPIFAMLRLASNREIQEKIPFTIDQFLTGDIRDGIIGGGNTIEWNQDEMSCSELIGTYYLYFFDQSMKEANDSFRYRPFRYGVLSIYESVKKNGGISVVAFARIFKSAEEAVDFRNDLERQPEDGSNPQDRQITVYREYDDTYSGSVALIGNHIFIDLFSFFYNDKGMIILTAPEKKPGSAYIGGLGNIVSVTHGAEHVPVSQKIILSREVINASDEEIASHLLQKNVIVEVDTEVQSLLDLTETLYSSKENGRYLDSVLDDADKRAILRQRLLQLIKNNINKSFNGLFMVTKQDDHSCYQFLKRHNRAELKPEGKDG